MVHVAGDTGWVAWTNTVDAEIANAAPLASPTFTGTVGGVNKAMVGLGSVDNTSDAGKPVSTAQAAAIGAKLDTTAAATTYAPLASPALTGTPTVNGSPIAGATAIGVQVGKNATQSATAATPTIVTFPTEDWDSSAFHDLVTNNSRLTIPTGLGGKYDIRGKVDFTSATVPGFTILSVYKNGAAFWCLMQTTLAVDGSVQGGTTVVLAAGDYIELVVQVATTSTMQSSGTDVTPCYFSAVRLGS
jgi:hypothetical protein